MAESSNRPRRSTRRPSRYAGSQADTHPVPASIPKRSTRRVQDSTPAEQLQTLLKHPKSALTTLNISDIINASTWQLLTPDSKFFLAQLLPPTAFLDFQPTIQPHHPSREDNAMEIGDNPSSSFSPDLLNTAVFSDPHFLAAAHTFQDHIFSGWMTDAHQEKMHEYNEGVKAGTMHAPWKDEVWDLENAEEQSSSVPTSSQPRSSARAGNAAELKLADLARNSVIRAGDILAYKRHFSMLDLIVEKDVLIEHIHPKTHSLTVFVEPGSTQYLPAHLVALDPSEPASGTQSMEVTSPSMLENGVLDIDGRVEKSKRPNGNAWKCFTVWRWRDESDVLAVGERGGRESHGTLFYLRGCYYHER